MIRDVELDEHLREELGVVRLLGEVELRAEMHLELVCELAPMALTIAGWSGS